VIYLCSSPAEVSLAPRFFSCDSDVYEIFKPEVAVAKSSTTKGPRKSVRDEKSAFGKDRRRKHHHFLVSVNYADGETFGRVYTNKEKATRFAERQRRSPIVKSARVTQVS
jgi:hypothetical protein